MEAFSYSQPLRNTYSFGAIAFTTALTHYIVPPPLAASGRVVDIHVRATVVFTNVTTPAYVQIGTPASAALYAQLAMGATAAGATWSLGIAGFAAWAGTASATGTAMTITATANGATGSIVQGMTVNGPGVPANTTIVSGSGNSWVLSNATGFSSTVQCWVGKTYTETNAAISSDINFVRDGISSVQIKVVAPTGGSPTGTGYLDISFAWF